MASPPLLGRPPLLGDRSRSRSPTKASAPLRWTVLLAVLCGSAYLAFAPPAGDLAAALYRANLFGHHPFGLYDLRWYGGHYLPSYSLLSPALSWLLGLRPLLVLSLVASSGGFALLMRDVWRERAPALVASLTFAFGFAVELLSGRVPFDLGVAFAIWSFAFCSSLKRPLLGLCLAPAATLASPVAGLFLAFVGWSAALWQAVWAGRARALLGTQFWVGLLALLPLSLLLPLFPEGGREPFLGDAFWPAFAASLAFGTLIHLGKLERRVVGPVVLASFLYAALLLVSFLVPTPLGSNALRLGPLVGPPLAFGGLWRRRKARRLRLLALLALPALLYWQSASAIDDQLALAGVRGTSPSFYSPLRAELLRLAHKRPLRLEVPLTKPHLEAALLPGGPILLARGWERQLDTRYYPLFYRPRLSAAAYRRFLNQNSVAYVALPKTAFDRAGAAEARLIGRGLPYLREIWQNSEWRLYRVLDGPALLRTPGRLLRVGAEGLTARLPRPGRYYLSFRYTPYWTFQRGAGCVVPAANGYSALLVGRPERVRLVVSLSLGNLFGRAQTCPRPVDIRHQLVR